MKSLMILCMAARIALGVTTYPIVDTGQTAGFGDYKRQEAHYFANAPSYADSGGGVENVDAPVAREQSKQRRWRGPPEGGQDSRSPGQRAGGRAPRTTGEFLERFDRNRDGRVSREEFGGPPRRFPMMDRDGDGVLSLQEIESRPQRRPRGEGAEARPFEALEAGREPSASAPPGRTSKPSFILILTDDMGWTGLSVAMHDRIEGSKSDYYQTPNIEALAKQGMRFSNAYSPGPMCTPSRAGILTGKTPAELHLTTPGGGQPSSESHQRVITFKQANGLPEKEDTVAELLKEKGYATAHFGKWHLGRVSPGEHGFDYHDGTTENDGPGLYKDPNPKDVFGITRRAIDFVTGQVQAGRPFYLQLSHYAVHGPNEALQTSISKFKALPTGKRHINAEYAAMTHDLDTAVGTLLETIDELSIADNTYVVLMSDNGAPGGRRTAPIPHNTPLAKGKGTLYEGGIRVPLMVRGPGIKANTFCSESVTGCDLLPTFCELASAKTGSIEGASLMPLLRGHPEEFKRSEDSLIFHYPHYNQGPHQPHSAIILENFKLLKHYDSNTVELFDLDADIGESNDLSRAMPERADELKTLLEKRLRQVNAQVPRPNPDYDPHADSGTGWRRGRRQR